MRKLILISKTSKYNTCSSVVRFLVDIFSDSVYKKILLEKYGIDVITDLKLESMNTFLKNADGFDDAILLGIQPYGFYGICELDETVIKNRRIKRIGWQDDPHFLAGPVKNRDVKIQNYCNKIYPIPPLETLDKFITPSRLYFKNLNITEYDHKIVDFFYFLNPDYFNKLLCRPYSERKSEIILSGDISPGYVSRNEFNRLREVSKDFKKIIFYLRHPSYVYEKNISMTEWNYYNKLSEYRGAFVGHHKFPLDFLLGKHIEVLMCGCLGFFEPNHLLEPQLGLKENIHYISCYKSGNLIKDYNFYKEWIECEEGKKIAKQGQDYVMENFGETRIHKFFELIKNF